MKPGEGLEERVASVRPAPAPAPKWGLPQPVAVVAMAGGGAAQFGIAALLAPATPTPTPFPSGQLGCHRWRYTLKWDRPSRLATLKNSLGNSVTIRKSYKAPGAGTQDDWPDPIATSIDWSGASNAGAWDWKNPPAAASTVIPWQHDCDDGSGPACGAGEHPGIWYESGYADPSGAIIAPIDPHGEIVAWSWTLNYGYGNFPTNDIIYGLDPGPPFLAYDMTTEVGRRLDPERHGHAARVPEHVHDPRGRRITPSVPPVPPATVGTPGVNEPTWQTLLPSDVVGHHEKPGELGPHDVPGHLVRFHSVQLVH